MLLEWKAAWGINIALAKGGTEAVIKFYYRIMDSQQRSGFQLKETLALRYKVIMKMFMRLCSCLLVYVPIVLSGGASPTIKSHYANIFMFLTVKQSVSKEMNDDKQLFA